MAAKAAEAKFEDNQRRLAKHKAKQAKKGKGTGEGLDEQLDAAADAFGADLAKDTKIGALGWIVAHRKVVIAVVVVLLAGGVFFAFCKITKYQLKTIPGQPRSELLIAGPAGDGTVIVIDHVAVGGGAKSSSPGKPTAEGERLTAIDAATGKELAVNVSSYAECWAGGTRVVCVDQYDRVDLLDPRTLDVTHAANDLIAAAELPKATRRYHREGERVVVVLEDGRGAAIDPSTAKVTVLDSVETPFSRPVSSSCDTTSSYSIGATRWLFDRGGTRQRLTSDPPPPGLAEKPRPEESPGMAEKAWPEDPSGPALTYLEPGFLATMPPKPLVLHAATMEQRNALLSRIEGISKESWKVDLGGECRRAWVSGERVIVVTSNPAQRALAIDLASGAVVWKFGR